MAKTLHQRQKSYEKAHDQYVLPRIPIIVKLDGLNFTKVTSKVGKPFDVTVMRLLGQTMLACLKAAEGAVFGYQYSDKIVLVLRNDQNQNTEAWYGNHIQKIGSVMSATATHAFASALWQEEKTPELDGPVLFSSLVFGVPTIAESINYLIYRQLRCTQDAINASCLHFGIHMDRSSVEERRQQLETTTNVSFDKLYPLAFTQGVGAYSVPSIANTTRGPVTRQRWLVDIELPRFSENREFLKTIISTGSDTFRPDRDFNSDENIGIQELYQ